MAFSPGDDVFRARITELVEDPDLAFTDSERMEVMNMVGHGEPEVALHNLAWIIQEEGKNPSDATLVKVAEIVRGVVDLGDLPPRIAQLVKVLL